MAKPLSGSCRASVSVGGCGSTDSILVRGIQSYFLLMSESKSLFALCVISIINPHIISPRADTKSYCISTATGQSLENLRQQLPRNHSATYG